MLGANRMDAEVNSFRLNYRIENKTNEEVIVRAKGGLGYIIRRSKEPTYNKRRRVHVQIPGVILENLLIDQAGALTLFDKELLGMIAKERDRIKLRDAFEYSTFCHDINVSILLTTELIEKNDAIHSEILGITLYVGAVNANQPSLNTPAYTVKELCAVTIANQPAPEGGLSCFIYLNDPRRVRNTLYANILGKATEIPTVNDNDRAPGLYIGVMYGKESQVTPYYTLDSLDKKTLESLGLFETKTDCELGGNTERAILAENKARDVLKELSKAKLEVIDLSDILVKAEETNHRLNKEIATLKQEHKTELTILKHEYKMEVQQLKHQAKMSGDMFNYTTRMKDTANKANMDFIKQKSSVNNWGEFAKAVGAVATVAFTGYKLFTS